jgi:hypothetical protein
VHSVLVGSSSMSCDKASADKGAEAGRAIKCDFGAGSGLGGCRLNSKLVVSISVLGDISVPHWYVRLVLIYHCILTGVFGVVLCEIDVNADVLVGCHV